MRQDHRPYKRRSAGGYLLEEFTWSELRRRFGGRIPHYITEGLLNRRAVKMLTGYLTLERE